jgi:A/G-specific adenine glycosylase
LSRATFRRRLLAWYDANRRALPWRESSDFYRVWLSEIMLQQTRVEAVIPFYLGFLDRFPTIEALAEAPEAAVLNAWSGLGYYSRARNLHKAAKTIAHDGLPSTHEGVLALPGVGPYTAAAIASIALGEAHAAVDGNVIRVVSRLANDTGEVSSAPVRERLGKEAWRLLDPRRPGDFNQALMELGATVCVPASPRCEVCPVSAWCAGRAAGRERELPVKLRKPAARDIALDLLVLLRDGDLFLIQRDASEKRLASFWELPEKRRFTVPAELAGSFTHRIVNDRFLVAVWRAQASRKAATGGQWFAPDRLAEIPLTTISRKALHLAHNFGAGGALEY